MGECAEDELERAESHEDREVLCWDCPPVGYPTDKTRCAECPRRAQPQDAPR